MPYANKISGVYIITCLVNNKHYIGKSINCLNRMAMHRQALKKGKHHSFHLQRAWDKYGNCNFTFDILEEYVEKYLPSMERYWINMLDSTNRKFGYNIFLPNPDGGNEVDIITREKIRNSRLGKKASLETRKKISDANINKVLTNEQYTKFRKGSLNYIETEKFKNDKERKKIEIGRRVTIFNYKTYEYESFICLADAARKLNTTDSNIHRCIDYPTRSIKDYLVISSDKFDKEKIYLKEKKKYSNEAVSKRLEKMKIIYDRRKKVKMGEF